MLYVYHHHRWLVILIISLQGPKDLSAKSLYELNLLSAAEADQAKQEYHKFMSSVIVTNEEKFFSFDQDKDRLDSFFGSLMQANADLFNLWKVCRIIFVLSHGQADIERGFSING